MQFFKFSKKEITSSESDDRLSIFTIYDAFSNGVSRDIITLTFDLKSQNNIRNQYAKLAFSIKVELLAPMARADRHLYMT